MSLRERMPLLARHEGVWDGYYRYFDNSGNKVDEHKSRILCRMLGADDYHQTNYYFWADGRKDTRDFPAIVKEDRLVFYTEISGWAAEVPLDENNRTIMLHWTRNNEPDLYLYEMIQISDCGQYRARVWQWFRQGRLFMRTLVDEQRISEDWQAYDNKQAGYADVAVF
ncbi:MAG: DUF3598 domain-containing protein [Gammaproteobacteria bacterium]|nr:DUF3598 domain-containing protein [Gammaproteobacteria bacterium]